MIIVLCSPETRGHVGKMTEIAPAVDITHLHVDIITFARLVLAPPPDMFFSQLPLLLVVMIELGLRQACELSLGVSQKRS